MKIAVYDLECKVSPYECGGWKDYKGMGISSGVVWYSWRGGQFGTTEVYSGDQVDQLAARLEEADVVVSFNGLTFDNNLLSAVLGRSIRIKANCDLMARVEAAIGKRPKLDALAEATLGEGKCGHGQHAPQLARAGRWAELHTYNIRDVMLTLRLFWFAKENGYLLWMLDGELLRIPIQVPGGVPAHKMPGHKKANLQQPSRNALITDAQAARLQLLKQFEGIQNWKPTPGTTKEWASSEIRRIQKNCGLAGMSFGQLRQQLAKRQKVQSARVGVGP